jgi:cyclase
MSSTTHEIRTPAPPIVQEVSDGVFAYVQPDGTWWINNTGFVVGRDRAAAIDASSTEARTRALIGAIGKVTPQPVRTLVNTHHHGDHTHGNGLFTDATIIAHEKTREEILAEGKPGTSALIRSGTWNDVDWGDLPLAPPFLTYTTGVDLWVDDLKCEVRHGGTPAHSTNDSIVWLPSRKVLFAGDLLFNGGTPFLVAGSVAGALEAVSGLKDLGAETIVPGHGPVCGPEVIDDVLAYLRFVLDLAERGVASGTPPLELARSIDLGRFAELTDRERLVGNLHRAYAELRGAERGAPIDFTAALGDMRAYNGGAPLTCLA